MTGDPLFVNLPAGQFNLGEGSPAINQGDPAQAYADPDGTANDIGAFDAASAHTIWWKTDFPPALGSKQE